ncbi:MAG: hypothetical protein H6555_10475 [Lewinellaceae bacterium]|nr:hypothetical protein [Lewinellaceae bacterium]
MKTVMLLPCFMLFFLGYAFAQEEEFYEELSSSEMSIPSAPAFALLGVNPEVVLRPSDLRSFKVDWRIKNYNLAPDLALEAQPFWHLYYKNRPFNEYVNAGPLARRLSTLSLSLGTAKIDGVNHAAYSVKMNLYSENDLFSDRELIAELAREHDASMGLVQRKIDSLSIQRFQTNDPEEKQFIQEEIDALHFQKRTISVEAKEKYRSAIEEYQYGHWNRTMLDGAFGMVYTYDNQGLDSLKVKRAGLAFWLNGALKIGRHGLVTGIFKFTKVIDSSNKLFGVSYRYGNPKFNFFTEVAFETLGNYFDPTQEEMFDEGEVFANNFAQDLGSGWLNFNNTGNRSQYTIAYGGDFRLSRNILLNFSLRTQFTGAMKMERLLPVANVICLMK